MESGYGNAPGIERLAMGIAALDCASGGGLPKRRSALVTGGTEQLVLLGAAPFKGEWEMVEADQHYLLAPLVATIVRTTERVKTRQDAPWTVDGKRPVSPARPYGYGKQGFGPLSIP